jgi:nucleoside-diphosphate-sugar epimerase
LQVVIIRPPLVYGPNAPGNFGSLMRWVRQGIPLPFGAVHNKRSLVALSNLVSFVIHCVDHPKAANEIFLICDSEDVSTTELIKRMAKASGKKPLLIPVPVGLMQLAARLIGKEELANRLFGSLQIDNSKAKELLGWKPVITMAQQLHKSVDANLNEKTV